MLYINEYYKIMESIPINNELQDAQQTSDSSTYLCGLTKQEFDRTPKLLLLGKTQNGKSSLLINLCHPAAQEELKKKVKVGNGMESCTKDLQFYSIILRETQERVIVIDAPGLDDGTDAKADEAIMV